MPHNKSKMLAKGSMGLCSLLELARTDQARKVSTFALIDRALELFDDLDHAVSDDIAEWRRFDELDLKAAWDSNDPENDSNRTSDEQIEWANLQRKYI